MARHLTLRVVARAAARQGAPALLRVGGRRSLNLGRRHHRARDPRRRAPARESVPGRTSLIGRPHRRRKPPQPLHRLRDERRRPQAPQLANPRIQHTHHRSVRVHVQPNPCALGHTGAPVIAALPLAPVATAIGANLRARRRVCALRPRAVTSPRSPRPRQARSAWHARCRRARGGSRRTPAARSLARHPARARPTSRHTRARAGGTR